MMIWSFCLILFAPFFIDTVKSNDDAYIPCKSYISYSFDDSNSLHSVQFKNQLDFIKYSIGTFNHPERLRVEGAFTSEFDWNSGLSITQMQSALSNAIQTQNTYSLLQEFANLLTSVKALGNVSDPIVAFIFISNTSDSAVANADRLLPQLKGIRLNFVLLGSNANATKLTQFSEHFIRWSPIYNDNFPTVYSEDYGCTNYLPCQNYISVLIDISYTLSIFQFPRQMGFLSQIFDNVTHFERIEFGIYNDNALSTMITYPFNAKNDKSGFNAALKNIFQVKEAANLNRAMTMLATNSYNKTIPRTALIFVTDTSDNDMIQAALETYNTYLKNSTKLTFILAGTKVDAYKLQGFEDALMYTWETMAFSTLPDGWDIAKAFRCTPTLPSLTSPTPPLPNPADLVPYFPCQSWIGLGIDRSAKLDPDSFKKVLNFVSSAIRAINHPERIHFSWLNDNGNYIPWNNNLSTSDIQNSITSMTQFSSSFFQIFVSLKKDLIVTQVSPAPVSVIAFVTDTSDVYLSYIQQYMSFISKYARVTFVITGPFAESGPLRQYAPKANYIYWNDLSQPQPDSWEILSPLAYGCETLVT